MIRFTLMSLFIAAVFRFAWSGEPLKKESALISTWVLVVIGLRVLIGSVHGFASLLVGLLLLAAAVYTWSYTVRYKQKAPLSDIQTLATVFVDDYLANLSDTVKKLAGNIVVDPQSRKAAATVKSWTLATAERLRAPWRSRGKRRPPLRTGGMERTASRAGQGLSGFFDTENESRGFKKSYGRGQYRKNERQTFTSTLLLLAFFLLLTSAALALFAHHYPAEYAGLLRLLGL